MTERSSDSNLRNEDSQSSKQSCEKQQKDKRRRGPKSHGKSKPPRPDHFFALRLSHDASVVTAIERLQAALKDHSPHLEHSFVDPITAHLTLGVLTLSDEESKTLAVRALHEAVASLGWHGPSPAQERSRPDDTGDYVGDDGGAQSSGNDPMTPSNQLVLHMKGLGHFRNTVLYLKTEEGNGVHQAKALAATLHRRLRELAPHLIPASRKTKSRSSPDENAARSETAVSETPFDEEQFVPHVTVAKLSKMPPWQQRKIAERLAAAAAEDDDDATVEADDDDHHQQEEENNKEAQGRETAIDQEAVRCDSNAEERFENALDEPLNFSIEEEKYAATEVRIKSGMPMELDVSLGVQETSSCTRTTRDFNVDGSRMDWLEIEASKAAKEAMEEGLFEEDVSGASALALHSSGRDPTAMDTGDVSTWRSADAIDANGLQERELRMRMNSQTRSDPSHHQESMGTRRRSRFKRSSRRLQIPPEAYEAHQEIEIRNVTVTAVELCCMAGRRPDAYYETICTVPLHNVKLSDVTDAPSMS